MKNLVFGLSSILIFAILSFGALIVWLDYSEEPEIKEGVVTLKAEYAGQNKELVQSAYGKIIQINNNKDRCWYWVRVSTVVDGRVIEKDFCVDLDLFEKITIGDTYGVKYNQPNYTIINVH